MYARLDGVSRWLEWLGLDHRAGYARMLERLAGARHDELRRLADVVEPLDNYQRGGTREYTQQTPLVRLVDAARPESDVARAFAREVDRLLADPARRAGREAVRSRLVEWQGLEARLRPLLEENELLREAVSPPPPRLPFWPRRASRRSGSSNRRRPPPSPGGGTARRSSRSRSARRTASRWRAGPRSGSSWRRPPGADSPAGLPRASSPSGLRPRPMARHAASAWSRRTTPFHVARTEARKALAGRSRRGPLVRVGRWQPTSS